MKRREFITLRPEQERGHSRRVPSSHRGGLSCQHAGGSVRPSWGGIRQCV